MQFPDPLYDPQPDLLFDKSIARMAGALYLLIAFAGAFSIAYVPSQLIDLGDAWTTSASILADPLLFNLGVLGDVVVIVSEIAVTVLLFFMFRAVAPLLALIASFARLSMAIIMAAMLFFYGAALALIEPNPALIGVPDEIRVPLAALMLQIHASGVWIWQIFFALHLFLLGLLVKRSGAYPRLLGTMMMIGAFGYLLDSLVAFAAIDTPLLTYAKVGLLTIVTLAEIGFALWLLLRGPAAPKGSARKRTD